MFPSPTEYPMMERKNCILPDHAARSPSSPSCGPPLVLDTTEPLPPERTIVTPGRPSWREFNGHSSCPFRVVSVFDMSLALAQTLTLH